MKASRRDGKSTARSVRPAQIYARAATRRRRLWRVGVVLILIVLAATAAWLTLAHGSRPLPTRSPGAVRVLDGRRVIESVDTAVPQATDPARQRALLKRVPRTRIRRVGQARIEERVGAPLLARRLKRALHSGGDIQVPYRAVFANITLPVVKQRLRNNCETAALSMLLRAQGINIGQLALQRQLPVAAPRDPRGQLWGDPDRGFVGRPEGGGPAGGYGVYERPVRALASRRGARLQNLSGRPLADIYRAVLRGEPVMLWVGLSNGPYRSWQTPDGTRVVGNLGEHTVVLRGLTRAGVLVNDPLTGTVQTWSRGRVRLLWKRLGQRALGAPARPSATN